MKKDKRVVSLFDAETEDKLRRVARDLNVARSVLIYTLIKDFIDEYYGIKRPQSRQDNYE